MVREVPSMGITSQLTLKEKEPIMQARGECSQTEGKACAEAPKWRSLACLMIREVFLPFHQLFVKCCPRIMLLSYRSLLLGYMCNILVLWFGYCLPLPIHFSKYLLIVYCVPGTGDLTVSRTQSLLVCVCLQTDREIKIMKIGMVCYCSPVYPQNLNRTWHI